MKKLLPIIVIILFQVSCKQKKLLFTKVSSEDSGVNFINQISENDFENFIDYSYIYNGGGVAVGDINGDNLLDLYFSGNQTGDKLFLNKTGKDGKLKFEDITTKANIKQGGWSTGVTMADVNADGKLDIYVCKSGNYSAEKRANQLYINQGDNSFLEQAKEYNLADTSYSTQAAFFDFDHDKDLDLFIITSTNNIRNPNELKVRSEEEIAQSADRLYENLGNEKFEDISKKAGIHHFGMSLGLSIADFNKDGWDDIFVGNDFLANDLLYINNQKGGFFENSKQSFYHHSQFSMGCDAADINDDGSLDLISVDMKPSDYASFKKMVNPANNYYFEKSKSMGFFPQFMRNMFFLNQGNYGKNLNEIDIPRFSEIGQMAGIEQTDWSWSPLIADFDNDGMKDIFISNGYLRDITDLDFITGNMDFAEQNGKEKTNTYMKSQARKMPSMLKTNRFFRNKGKCAFEDVSETWVENAPSISNGAAYADLDNDGDLDLIVNNINQMADIFQNNAKNNYLTLKLIGDGKNVNAIGAKIEINVGKKQQVLYQNTTRGFQSSSSNLLHFGLGESNLIDSVKITFNEHQLVLKNVKSNQQLLVNLANGKHFVEKDWVNNTFFEETFPADNFNHTEIPFDDFNIEPLLPHRFSKEGPKMTKGDINGDGLEDFFVGGAYRQSGAFFIQQRSGNFKRQDLLNQKNIKEEEDTYVKFFDADNDKDLDLYIVSGSNEYFDGSKNFQDRLYINDGKGNFQLSSLLPLITHSGSVVAVSDFDKDGDLDIFRGGRMIPTQYPKPGISSFLVNNRIGFVDETNRICPELLEIGMVTDAIWTDLDHDSWDDLVIVGELMQVTIFKNSKGKLQKTNFGKNTEGFWRCVKSIDIDKDGDMDLVLGNMGNNIPKKVTVDNPYTVYSGDFDSNSRWDAISTSFWNGIEYPVHSFDDLRRQLPILRTRFTTYASFSEATLEQVLTPEAKSNALIKIARTSESLLLINDGNFNFTSISLPDEIQRSTVNDMLFFDINHDGFEDIITIGNDFGIESFSGQIDGTYGGVVLNLGKNNFQYVAPSVSGLWLLGEGMSAISVNLANNKKQVLISRNNQSLQFFNFVK